MNLVLMYHRVAAVHHDPFDLAVHPDRFTAQIEHLVELGSTVPLEEVTGSRHRNGIAVTFDDGYADNATVAAPRLSAAGVPATFFITAGRLGRRHFWWDRVTEALLGPDLLESSVDVEVAGRGYWLDLRTQAARHRSMRFLHKKLRPLPPDVLEPAVDELLLRLRTSAAGDEHFTMTTEQMRSLAGLPLQDVGGHTRTHVQLRGQIEALQRSEVLGSIGDLTGLLGRPVRTFAYPFGDELAVGSTAPRLVEEAGCTVACTTSPGLVRPRTKPYLLPRLHVRNWDRDEFAARLSRAMTHR
jgi:peptidoglycan/xylan/chitin deacetylase (PgdA/CDA1 family)